MKQESEDFAEWRRLETTVAKAKEAKAQAKNVRDALLQACQGSSDPQVRALAATWIVLRGVVETYAGEVLTLDGVL